MDALEIKQEPSGISEMEMDISQTGDQLSLSFQRHGISYRRGIGVRVKGVTGRDAIVAQ